MKLNYAPAIPTTGTYFKSVFKAFPTGKNKWYLNILSNRLLVIIPLTEIYFVCYKSTGKNTLKAFNSF